MRRIINLLCGMTGHGVARFDLVGLESESFTEMNAMV